MAYVAARGGEESIQQAERLFEHLRGPLTLDMVESIETHLPMLIDRVMGEASLYAPKLAALAIAQTGGDLYEAVLLLRAYRSTQPRLAYAAPIDYRKMTTVRRISAAFKDIPDGQILGPTLDYSHRLLKLEVLDEGAEDAEPAKRAEAASPKEYTPVVEWERAQKLASPLPENGNPVDPSEIPDLTRGPLLFPVPRAHRLQALARADTGGILSLGYANMRGYGGIHPTVNEVRLAYADIEVKHPVTGAPFSLGKIRVSQNEIVSPFKESSERPELDLGFCATMGWNEVKVIAGSMLDRAMDKDDPHPALKEEFVLYHTELVEASGFCIHYKLPHYVTFNSDLDAMRKALDAMGFLKQPENEGKSNTKANAAEGEPK